MITLTITSSNKAAAFGLLALVFVAGGLAGAAIDRAAVRRQAERTAQTRAETPHPPNPAERRRGDIQPDQIPFVFESFNLTSEEKERLHAIARRWRPRAAEALSQVAANVSDLENDMFAEMLCVLSKDKQDMFLARLQEGGQNTVIIDKRFRLVRSGQCERVRRGESPLR